MITAIALDDEPPALQLITAFCDRIKDVNLQGVFTKTSIALEYLQKNQVDLLLLDVNMPAMNGIEFHTHVSVDTMVIFTTAHTEFAVKSYELQALDYLVKPFSFNRFEQAIRKANERKALHKNQVPARQTDLIVRVDYGLVKIPISEIEFIEGLDNYLKIHTHTNQPLVVRMTIKAVLENLPTPDFIRVHRSYVIPMKKVASFRNKIIILSGGEEIPLSTTYEQTFISLFANGTL